MAKKMILFVIAPSLVAIQAAGCSSESPESAGVVAIDGQHLGVLDVGDRCGAQQTLVTGTQTETYQGGPGTPVEFAASGTLGQEGSPASDIVSCDYSFVNGCQWYPGPVTPPTQPCVSGSLQTFLYGALASFPPVSSLSGQVITIPVGAFDAGIPNAGQLSQFCLQNMTQQMMNELQSQCTGATTTGTNQYSCCIARGADAGSSSGSGSSGSSSSGGKSSSGVMAPNPPR